MKNYLVVRSKVNETFFETHKTLFRNENKEGEIEVRVELNPPLNKFFGRSLLENVFTYAQKVDVKVKTTSEELLITGENHCGFFIVPNFSKEEIEKLNVELKKLIIEK